MQGKLKSFVALNDANGTHVTFTNERGTYYKFTVELEHSAGIDKGTAMSSKQQPNWKIGDEYTYEKKVSGEQNQYTNISGLKAVDGFGGSKSNPTFCIQKCYEAAVETACSYFELNPEHSTLENIDKLITSINIFLVTPTEESKRWMNVSGIRGAIQTLRAVPNPKLREGQTLSAWLLEKAGLIATNMDSSIQKQLEIDKQPK